MSADNRPTPQSMRVKVITNPVAITAEVLRLRVKDVRDQAGNKVHTKIKNQPTEKHVTIDWDASPEFDETLMFVAVGEWEKCPCCNDVGPVFFTFALLFPENFEEKCDKCLGERRKFAENIARDLHERSAARMTAISERKTNHPTN